MSAQKPKLCTPGIPCEHQAAGELAHAELHARRWNLVFYRDVKTGEVDGITFKVFVDMVHLSGHCVEEVCSRLWRAVRRQRHEAATTAGFVQ